MPFGYAGIALAGYSRIFCCFFHSWSEKNYQLYDNGLVQIRISVFLVKKNPNFKFHSAIPGPSSPDPRIFFSWLCLEILNKSEWKHQTFSYLTGFPSSQGEEKPTYPLFLSFDRKHTMFSWHKGQQSIHAFFCNKNQENFAKAQMFLILTKNEAELFLCS